MWARFVFVWTYITGKCIGCIYKCGQCFAYAYYHGALKLKIAYAYYQEGHSFIVIPLKEY